MGKQRALNHYGATVIKDVILVQRSPDQWKSWSLGTDSRIYKAKHMIKDTPTYTKNKWYGLSNNGIKELVVFQELFKQKYQVRYSYCTSKYVSDENKSSIETTNPLKSRRKYGRKLKWFQGEKEHSTLRKNRKIDIYNYMQI